jgi:hypothetical protein
MPLYSHTSGTANTTVEVPADYRAIKRYWCVGDTGGGTVTITPRAGAAQDAITVPENAPFADEFCTDPADADCAVELPSGSSIAFAGVKAWYVRFV